MTKKNIGLSKNAPHSDAQPLGTPRLKKSALNATIEALSANVLASLDAPAVISNTTDSNDNVNSNSNVNNSVNVNNQKEGFTMITLHRDHKNRRSTLCVFTSPDLRAAIRLPKTVFAGDVPETFTIDAPEGTFAGAKSARVPMTKEERKAARLARPKLTNAQKFAKQEARLAKLRAKMEADEAKANESTETPATESTPDAVSASM